MQKIFKKLNDNLEYKNFYIDGSNLRETESVANEVLSLPMYPELEEKDFLKVTEIIKKYCQVKR